MVDAVGIAPQSKRRVLAGPAMDRRPDNSSERVGIAFDCRPPRRLAGGIAVLLIVLIAAAPLAAARTPQILAFGDSLTAGLGLAPDKSFPARLETKLRSEGIAA